MTKNVIRLLTATACVVALFGVVPTTASGSLPVDRHCVVEVVAERDGVLLTGPEDCRATYDQASIAAENSASSDNTIGVHFTGTGYSGSSITIVGTVCSGGVWYPTGTWNNNIASSYHYCGSKPTTFYDSSSCSGAAHAIYSSASSLYAMNDKASCVRYG